MIFELNYANQEKELAEGRRRYREQMNSQYTAGYTDAEEKYKAEIAKKQAEIAEKDTLIAKRDAEIAEKEALIAKRKAEIAEKEALITKKKNEIAEKEALAIELKAILTEAKDAIANKST